MRDDIMNGSWFFDENFNGVPDDFFDDALKYLDLPHEDLEPNDGEDWAAKFQHLDPPPSSVLTSLSSGFGSGNDASKVKKSSSISWQSTAEASLSITSLCDDSLERKHPHHFRTSSPISVLESSSSSSSCCPEKLTSNYAKSAIPVTRPRSKHSRSRRSGFPFGFTCSTRKTLYSLAASESGSDSWLDEKVFNPAKKREKRKNLMLLSSSEAFEKQLSQPQEAVETRKCTHCEVTKTPQWREGPMGPKTLCNACGVRFRSGRLLPEYRPAASPTFSPLLHSNSHRKVLEMRTRTVLATRRNSAPVTQTATVATSSPAREGLSF
ncbi:hypothetical protein K2173_023508 [Erythroxylum novogranatense]|uniref:GATA-type domain-containing protein n=1 Tax=Erythroxylum novogranatense TaxID=1862640 RepID=A0AAV8TRA5_9ROSI|nr:hypothetical protein K2173_023508 [Erythroxylum novogranatense]